MTERIIGIDRLENLINVFGAFDENLHLLEKELQVSIIDRDSELHISGDEENTAYAEQAIEGLMKLAARGEPINAQNVRYVLKLAREGRMDQLSRIQDDVVCVTAKGRPIKAKTLGQRTYIDAIRKNTVTLAVGPAGTGKTYLAMAMAITAFRSDEVNRIILTRPAIEAGEKLGFLPGDLQSKVDPYLRPLYDALYQIMGADSFQKNMEKGLIEVAPLAYMRGRTLDNAYIILDEAQNTTPAQMKMFLTRIGFGSKVIVTGDATQKDLAAGVTSGLDVATRILPGVEDIAFCELTSKDVVRHPLVQRIVQAYENYEKKQASKKSSRSAAEKRSRRT